MDQQYDQYDAPEPTDEELTAGMTPAEALAGPGITKLREQWRDAHRIPTPSVGTSDAGSPDEARSAGDPAPPRRSLRAWLRAKVAPGPAKPIEPAEPSTATSTGFSQPAGNRGGSPSHPRSVAIPPASVKVARRIALVLAALLALVILVAFRGSWTSQSDSALATHFDDWGAWLYPFGPDGLIVLALVGAVVLRHKSWPRFYCLAVVTLFTMTSFVINYLHGQGSFVMVDGVLIRPLEKWIVGLVAVQLVGAIAFGSHILMHIFRHLFPEALDIPAAGLLVAELQETEPEEITEIEETTEPQEITAGSPDAGDPPPTAEPDPRVLARLVYGACLDAEVKLSRAKLATIAGISERQAGYAQVDVDTDRKAAAEAASTAEAAEPVAPMHTKTLMSEEAMAMLGGEPARVNGSGPNGRSALDGGA